MMEGSQVSHIIIMYMFIYVVIVICHINEWLNDLKVVEINKEKLEQMNPPKFDMAEDMANMTYLNEASVMGNLRARYQKLLIYVSRGQLSTNQRNAPTTYTPTGSIHTYICILGPKFYNRTVHATPLEP